MMDDYANTVRVGITHELIVKISKQRDCCTALGLIPYIATPIIRDG
jgi:hypothetical protein